MHYSSHYCARLVRTSVLVLSTQYPSTVTPASYAHGLEELEKQKWARKNLFVSIMFNLVVKECNIHEVT